MAETTRIDDRPCQQRAEAGRCGAPVREELQEQQVQRPNAGFTIHDVNHASQTPPETSIGEHRLREVAEHERRTRGAGEEQQQPADRVPRLARHDHDRERSEAQRQRQQDEDRPVRARAGVDVREERDHEAGRDRDCRVDREHDGEDVWDESSHPYGARVLGPVS